MRKYLLLAVLLLIHSICISQNNFSFSCSRDTVLNCDQNCITLQALIPDIRLSSATYAVNQAIAGCFLPAVAPGSPGEPTNLTLDDFYSRPIDVGFNFPFFGVVYSQLIAVSNGMISFDLSKATRVTHYEMLTSGGVLSAISGRPLDLPSALYDRAVIMGPYHDLDPGAANAPATTQIKHDITGVAPHRRWTISYNTVPLFGGITGCDVLNRNTHQITLYESLGVVEVNIFSKEICAAWNEGRAILGMQSFDRSQAIMAPGRAASDNPWGSAGMNETWRFTPATGPSLFKRVELFSLAGNLVATGDTVSDVNNMLKVSFQNICAGTSQSYIVKTTYKKFDDTTQEIYIHDTINIIRNSALLPPLAAVVTDATCSIPGTINIINPRGIDFEYSSNGGATYQASPLFNLPAGTYSMVARNTTGGCTTTPKLIIIKSGSDLGATATVTDATCPGSASGTIEVVAKLGTPAYSYSLNGGTFQTSPIFTGIVPGTYNITVRDVNNCSFSLTARVGAGAGLIARVVSENAACSGSATGTITVVPATGIAPFLYTLNTGVPQASAVFTGLAAGSYTIRFTDVNGCIGTVTTVVDNNPGITATINTINAACAGNASGQLIITPSSGTAPYTYSLNNGLPQLSDTFYNLLPGRYTISIKDAAGCNFITQATIRTSLGVTATTVVSNASCAAFPNGSIIVNVNSGRAPYTFLLNGGTAQGSGTFTGLFAGSFAILVKDAAGCSTIVYDTVRNEPVVAVALALINPLCNAQNNGSITITASLGVAPYQYAINSGAYQPVNVFSNLTAGNYVVHTKDNNGCITDTQVILTQPVLLINTIAGIKDATCTGTLDGQITANAAGGTMPYQYTLDVNGVAGYQANSTFAVAPGNYQVTVKDNLGCKTTVPAVVKLSDSMRLLLTADTTTCAGAALVLMPQTSTETTEFTWTPATGLNNTSIKNPVATPVDTTTYTLVAKWGICMRTAAIKINVLKKPVAFAGNDTAICNQSIAVLSGSARNLSGSVRYQWSPATGIAKADTAYTIARPGTTLTYTLTVSDNYGCNFLVTDEVVITQQPPVPAFAGNDTIAVSGVPHQLRAAGGVNYLWEPALLLNNANIAAPLATLTAGATFIVNVTDIAGCKATDTIYVGVLKGPAYYIPTAFSPDANGLNDIFRPRQAGIAFTTYFRVFNRYGQLVFESNRAEAGWDGTYKGVKQPGGAYIWMIKGQDGNGRKIELKGTVMLVR